MSDLAHTLLGDLIGSRVNWMTPMFPLGSVLMPAMPLPLRLFEPRYLAMLDAVLDRETLDFGVVLIERGSEVGGGDARFGVGTMARVEQVENGDGLAAVIARGTQRFSIDAWGPEDPWPQAEVTPLEDLRWSATHADQLAETEQTVRSTLARASEFVDVLWGPDVELSEDPLDRSWQLAGIALAGPLDQVALLGATSVEGLLSAVAAQSVAALETIHLQTD